MIQLALFASLIAGVILEDQTSQNHQTVTGMGSYGNEILDTLNGSGLVKLNGTTIQDTLYMEGSLITSSAILQTLDVTGEANLRDTLVTGKSSVKGSITAQGSTFRQNIDLCCRKAVFSSCTLEGITMKKINDYAHGKQTIQLSHGTVVKGSIVFESGRGEVLVHSKSQILGPVKGGTVIYQKQPNF